MSAHSPARPALPLSAYGAIGNLRSIALVGANGSVDWCCLPYLAAPSVFAALLDERRGGRFVVAPVSAPLGEQSYIEDTNVLCTHWRTERGRLCVTDFMPVVGALDGEAPPRARSELHRLVVCEAGEVEVEVEWAPRMDYARRPTRVERVPGGYLARQNSTLLSLGGLPGGHRLEDDGAGPCVRARFRLTAGERVALVTQWEAGPLYGTRMTTEAALKETVACWRAWVYKARACGGREWAGPWQALITRSELILKLLTVMDTGAIAAAATTSLPETIGGVRNWDYRFVWIRDGAFTAQALTALGHHNEAARFLQWAEEVADIHDHEDRRLQIMYGLHGEAELPEEELPHLAGYHGSRPVRIGNGAAEQAQHDIYGELLTAAYELVRHGQQLTPSQRRFLAELADETCQHWAEPDSGLWEMRKEPRHYTHSKLMCWAALDRALRMARHGILEGDVARWRETRERIREVVLREGYSEERGAFVQSFGSRELDASSVLIPIHELLPCNDPRVQSTLDATLAQLTENGFVYRYVADDGLPGREGAFGLTTFWLVDALALSGRLEEAERIFEGMARAASPLGLYAEQLDPRTGALLGNLPQAFTHLGLINSALYLAHARGERLPLPPLLGTEEHRREEGLRWLRKSHCARPQRRRTGRVRAPAMKAVLAAGLVASLAAVTAARGYRQTRRKGLARSLLTQGLS
jgi:GH15 family glucan-1,4-alpha-glucosidase